MIIRGIQAKNRGRIELLAWCCALLGVAAMIGEIKDEHPVDELEIDVEEDEVEDDDEALSADALDDDDDNIGDISVEINVEELVAKLEAAGEDDVERKRLIRKRLNELEEQRREAQDIDSTYNFNLDDEL